MTATAVPAADLSSIVLVLLAGTLAALLSRFHRRVVLPTVVIEILLGILIGPQVLDIAKVDPYLNFLSNLGLGFLFFIAGMEVIDKKVPQRALRIGSIGWAISLVLGLGIGLGLQEAGVDARWWLLGVALATTALGTLVPIVVDAGLLTTRLGTAMLGTGVAGEFWPIVFISIFLTGVYGALGEVLLLIAFCGVVAFAAVVMMRARPPRVVRAIQETVHTTGQAAVRGAILILAALVWLAVESGFDFVLGAFAAGLVVGLALDSPEAEGVRLRLEGIAFGVFIPVYFVTTGMTFDLDGLLTRGGLALAALFLGLFDADARLLGALLAEGARRPTDCGPGLLRRDRASADRRGRQHRRGARRNRPKRRRLAGRGRHALRPHLPAGGDPDRRPARAGEHGGRGVRRLRRGVPRLRSPPGRPRPTPGASAPRRRGSRARRAR